MNNYKKQNFFIAQKNYFIFLVLIICNEFLPQNHYLPKVKQIYEGIISLSSNYNLIENFLVSIITLYLCCLIGFVIVILLSPLIKLRTDEKLKSEAKFFILVPEILIAFLLNHWFPFSTVSSFIFLSFIVIMNLLIQLITELTSFYSTYIEPSLTLGRNQLKIKNTILRRGIQKPVVDIIINKQKELWSFLIIFEFIRGNEFGIGHLLKLSFDYWNNNFLFAIVCLLILFVFISNKILLYIKNKFFFWEI